MKTILLCFIVLFTLLIKGNDAVFSEYPVSINVSLHSTVMFTCTVPDGATVTLSWNGLSAADVEVSPNTLTPDGARHVTATFMASARFNNTIISCNAGGVINGAGIFENSPPALLLIQGPLSPVGNLTSTVVDHCTLRLTWTAPYTLQGVPILNYTIGVNVDTDLPYMFSSNTTEYLYTPNELGETYTIMVTASNQAGQGAGSEITVDIPKTDLTVSSNLIVSSATSLLSTSALPVEMTSGNSNMVTSTYLNASSNLIVSSATGLLSTSALPVEMTSGNSNMVTSTSELVPSVAVSPSAKPSASSIPTPDSFVITAVISSIAASCGTLLIVTIICIVIVLTCKCCLFHHKRKSPPQDVIPVSGNPAYEQVTQKSVP